LHRRDCEPGIVYDPKDDLIEVLLEDLDHLI